MDFQDEDVVDFNSHARCLLGECDDPDCLFCQDDDAEAAFWDEFMSEPEEGNFEVLPISVHVVDEISGEEQSFDQANFLPYTILLAN